MKIAFVYPATKYDLENHPDGLPIGLLYLTAVAEAAGVSVDILDVRHGKELPDPNHLNDYDVIGFTAMSMQITHALELAGNVRANGFQGNIVFGGPHASVAADHLKQQKAINAIFVGEAEETFMQYLAYLQGKPHELQRLWLRQKDANWIWHPGDKYIENLDALPLPAREKYRDLILRIRTINMTTTRGCPFLCNYCQPTKHILFGKKVRRRSVNSIMAEVEDAQTRYGIGGFSIDDDTFTFDKRAVLDLCERVKPLNLMWSCQSRSDIDEESLIAMRESGLDMLFVGVESGSQRVLDLMNKHNTVEKNVRFIELCNELGIKTWCNMMVGYPGETEDDLEKSLAFVKKTKPSLVCVSQVTPFPGTHLWERHREDVIERDWDEMARHVHHPKFGSLRSRQSILLYYVAMMTKDWNTAVHAEQLKLSPLMDRICRRSPRLLHFLLRVHVKHERLLSEGLATVRGGRMEEGINLLEKLARRYPRKSEALGHLGWLYFSSGRPEKAIAPYRKFLKLEPSNTEVRLHLGRALVLLKQESEAKKIFEEILAIDEAHVQAKEELQKLGI